MREQPSYQIGRCSPLQKRSDYHAGQKSQGWLQSQIRHY
jgi:hypothetical protein